MEVLKLEVLLLSFVVAALTCDLKETNQEIVNKAAVETHITETKPNIKTRYRQHYHVAPPVGWMNDPNGFSFFKDNYHLFYQFQPYSTTAGNIHWGHVTSKDLVTWTQLPIALLPELDTQIYSGSAIEIDGTLVLMYTAHKTLTFNDTYSYGNETQALAFSNDGIVFNKYKKNPVISSTPDNAVDFRDPKVWKHGEYYYVVLGSQTAKKLGRVILYRSSDMGSWEYLSEVAKSSGDLGYMWECPDFFELNGSHVLLMSPQGIPEANKTAGDRYHNQHQTGYIIGSFNYTTGTFVQTIPFQEIDYGHDFYATQTMEKDGKRFLIAWMGSWDGQFLERDDGWAGTMTIIRELTLKGDRILMKPVEAISNLRENAFDGTLITNGKIETLEQTGELIVTFDLTQDLSLSFQGVDDETAVVNLAWTISSQKISVTRTSSTATEVRQAEWKPVSSKSLRIFLDASSIEVFCGEGEMVFSSRVYPSGAWRVTNLASQTITVLAYKLKTSVPA